MSRVQAVRNHTYDFAKVHTVCCNVTAVIFMAVGLPFLITGSVLVAKYQQMWWNNGFTDLWEMAGQDADNTYYVKFACGVALVFFGVIFLIVGSISFACACCSMLAVRDEILPQTVFLQQQVPYPKEPAGCSNPAFCPQPAPSPMYFAQPPNYDQVVQMNAPTPAPVPVTSASGFPQPPQVPLPTSPQPPPPPQLAAAQPPPAPSAKGE